MITVISDIQGNKEALEAVLQQAGRSSAIYCAGDIVGYGPDPNDCCEMLRRHEVRCVQGNHDLVCSTYGHLDDPEGPVPDSQRRLAITSLEQMNEVAQEACRWTFEALTEENRRWLRELPLKRQEGDITMVHGCPGSDYHKLNTYLQEKFETVSSEAAEKGGFGFIGFCRELLEEVNSRILIVGHTHCAFKGYVFNYGFPTYMLPFFNRENWVVNPGSVGQPHDGWKASYATVSFPLFPYLRLSASFQLLKNNVKIRRAAYDREATIKKIRGMEGLNETARVMLMNWL